MSWRKLSRTLWPMAAGVAGGVFASFTYLAGLFLLADWLGSGAVRDSLVIVCLFGFPVAMLAGANASGKAVAGWFDPIEKC